MSAWAAENGGETTGPLLERLENIGRPIATAAGGGTVRFHVLSERTLAAYSWPSGEVFVSAGLLAAVSDQELAAAVAHEMGHLVNDGHIQGTVSIRGSTAPLDIEERADATGVAILQRAGISAQAMIAVLEKVAATAASHELQTEIQTRIQVLSREFPSGTGQILSVHP